MASDCEIDVRKCIVNKARMESARVDKLVLNFILVWYDFDLGLGFWCILDILDIFVTFDFFVCI